MKDIYNEFANLIDSYDVAFGTSGRWNLSLMVPVIGMGGYGDTRWPSSHMILLDTGHMLSNRAHCYGKLDAISRQNPHSLVITLCISNQDKITMLTPRIHLEKMSKPYLGQILIVDHQV